MNSNIWQALLPLESRDIVFKWFKQIHSRELSSRRIKEINSAAKQTREYFRNAELSYYTVKPLLLFYGVSSLSRALILLLNKSGGEETLRGGHGLESIGWNEILQTDIAVSLQNICKLKVRPNNGLFTKLVYATKNNHVLYTGGSLPGGCQTYRRPTELYDITLNDIFSRIPDLKKALLHTKVKALYARTTDFTLNENEGLKAKSPKFDLQNIESEYRNAGYSVTYEDQSGELKCNPTTLNEYPPLYTNSFVGMPFDKFPNLHIVVPFPENTYYSNLSITYILAYILSMLVRYYPTHWVSLAQGEKGDLVIQLLINP